MEAIGVNGELTFDGTTVVITRKNALGRMTVGTATTKLSVNTISDVRLKPAGKGLRGFIQFLFPEANESRNRFAKLSTAAANDPNSVLFTKKQQPQFEAVRTAVLEAAQRSAPDSS